MCTETEFWSNFLGSFSRFKVRNRHVTALIPSEYVSDSEFGWLARTIFRGYGDTTTSVAFN